MLSCYSKLNRLLGLAAFSALMGGSTATATVILDTGAVTFSATGTQTGRISRNGEASVWGVVKVFPGVLGSARLGFEAFSVDTVFPFLQISLDDPTASLFMTAYLNAYNPTDTPPNFGLDVNYLGDPGLSQPFGNPSSFQIVVAPNAHVVIPINELAVGGGAGAPFELLVEGFYSSSFSEVPEPGSWTLCGAGLLALFLCGMRTRGRSRCGSH